MKQIHMDEAGSSPTEPHVVYASALIDPDKQYWELERLIQERIESVIPEHMHADFYFHAKDVYGKWKKQEGWNWAKCDEIVGAWLTIAHDLNVPVGLSWIKKPIGDNGKCATNEEAQMLAFAEAVTLADEYMVEFAPAEVASLIVEDERGIRNRLRHMHRKLMAGGLKNYLNFNERVTHIKNGIMFASKQDAPLLQLSDAFAFAFRRYVGGYAGGERLWAIASGGARIEETLNLSGVGGGRILLWKEPPKDSGFKLRVAAPDRYPNEG